MTYKAEFNLFGFKMELEIPSDFNNYPLILIKSNFVLYNKMVGF